MSKNRRGNAPRDRKRPYHFPMPPMPGPPKQPPPPTPPDPGCGTGPDPRKLLERLRSIGRKKK